MTIPSYTDYLEHYGVKGMKWGVRKDRTTIQTSNTSKRPQRGEVVLDTKLDSGGSLVVRTDPPGRLAQALAKKFKSVRNVQESVHNFTLTNERGEKVGEASFLKTSSDTLELEWLGVRKAHRNKGYATAAMRGVIEYAKNNDITTLNLTATDMGAGIYESLGFKKTGDDGVYAGTYSMTIPEKIKHSADENLLDPEVFAQYLKAALNKYVPKSSETPESILTHTGVKGMAQEFPMGTVSYTDYLEHYGVKGMKWGVRRTDEQLGRRRAGKDEEPDFTRVGKDIRTQVSKMGVDSENLKSKYGVGEESRRGPSREQILKYAAIGISAGVLGYGLYKGAQASQPALINAVKKHNSTVVSRNAAFLAYGAATDGLEANWNSSVELPAGHIFKRVSSVAEKHARQTGFFASHLDGDLESYKAVLPQFWEGWKTGSPKKGGFINHYQAKVDIKAPSGKDSFELFKKIMNEDTDHWLGTAKEVTDTWSDARWKDLFVTSSLQFNNNSSPFTKRYFQELKDQGYNAVIDFNDAGKLSKQPLRLLNGNMFDIVKNEPLSPVDIYDAAVNWKKELIHAMTIPSYDNYLEHYGVKGMKWGVRRAARKAARLERQSADHKNAKAIKKKRLSQMSNSDLRALNERMELESKYRQLQTKKVTLRTGKKFVDDVLSYADTVNKATAFAKSPAVNSSIKLGKKVLKR